MHIYFINFIINIIKIIYTPIILPFRHKIRIYIYNYLIKNNITFLFPYGLKIKYMVFQIDNKVYLRIVKTNKFMFYFYFWFFWIWYDDEKYDNINLFKLYELCYKYPLLNRILNKDLKEIKNITKDVTFQNVNKGINLKKYFLSFFISLFYNNNNYYNLKFYNKTKNKLYTKLEIKNSQYVYKADYKL